MPPKKLVGYVPSTNVYSSLSFSILLDDHERGRGRPRDVKCVMSDIRTQPVVTMSVIY